MLFNEKFPRPSFNQLTLAVLLALSGGVSAAVDYSGDVRGSDLPPSGSKEWLDAGAIELGGGGDAFLRISNGSVVSGLVFSSVSSSFLKTIAVSGAGSQLNLVNVIRLQKGTVMSIEDGAQLNIDSGGGSGSFLLSDDAKLNVTGAGTQVNAPDGIVLTNTSTVNLSDNARIVSGDGIVLTDTATLNIGGEQGGPARAAGTVEAEYVDLRANSILNFNHTSDDYEFDAQIISYSVGTPVFGGTVNVESGTTTLTAQNNYAGETHITGGALRAGAENAFSANSSYDIARGGTLDLNGFSNTLGDTTNAGIIKLAGATAGALLTVNGNYTGNNGTLIFGSELEGDNSVTDRLLVTGDVSGTTNVRVTNLGGSGAETLDGIELITVQGSADSNAFAQDGRIVAGAYDYRLVRGDHNWYLTNRPDLESGNPIIPGDDEDNGGGDDGDNGEGDNGGGDNGDERVLRPEAGAYAANLATAATLFDTRMSDRQGTYYLDPVTGNSHYTSLWLRMSGDHNRLNAGNSQLSTRANSFVTMLGGDIAATDTARLGLMAGYGNSKSNTHSKLTGYGAKGQINGYTTGLYGTWFAEGTDEKGLWTDSTLQYSWFNNSVNGDDAASESYKSKGVSASLSAGYVIPLGEGERSAFFLQPQARVGWSGIKADDHIESNGTLVQGSGQGNVSSSLGVKAFMKGHSSLDENTGRQFGLFTEVNWINNSKEYAVRMDGVSVSQSGSRNIAEARVGVDGALGNGFGVKGTIGQQVGDKGWSDTSAAVNFSYTF